MTNIPTEIIKLAIEGGWVSEYPQEGTWLANYENYRAALDREFWCGLSKSLGWKEGRANWIEWGFVNNLVPQGLDDPVPEWQYHAHRFYQCVLSNQDPTEYWNELLANQKQV